MDNCNHFWVSRKDGWEEQCGAAICLICGEYNCCCEFMKEMRDFPTKLIERRKSLFYELGIEGNLHEIEKSYKEEEDEQEKA